MERLRAFLGPILLFSLFLPGNAAADVKPSDRIVCVLDFHRLGDDGTRDWLRRGLPDMLMATLTRTGPFAAVDRELLRDILREHGLVAKGLADSETGIRAGRLARADFLAAGSFFLDDDILNIQVRLIRLADQKTVSQADWEGPAAGVMEAPGDLSRDILAGLGTPFDEKFLTGLGDEIPLSVDTAEAFYSGMEAFDGGDYHLALSRYLEGLRSEESFLRLQREVFRMYYLLGRSDHAVLFARSTASRLMKTNIGGSLELLHMASQKALDPLDSVAAAITLLDKMDALARDHEQRTAEAAKTKSRVLQRVLVLADKAEPAMGTDLLSDPDLRFRIWTTEITSQLERRARTGEFHWLRRGDEWVREPVPEPSVFMWRMRALLDLARALASERKTEESLAYYRQILEEYAFLSDLPAFQRENRFYWDAGIRLEAHFMIFRHYGLTGRLLRDPVLTAKMIDAGEGAPFKRDLAISDPHPKARVWSRREDGSHEFFDFASPERRRITKVTFEAVANGPAWVTLYLPKAEGWPPQFDFSRRHAKIFLPRGRSSKTFEIPEGTGLLSLSVLWGPRWANSFREHLRSRRSVGGEPDLSWWQATFHTEPAAEAAPQALPSDHKADDILFRHYAGRWGWQSGRVIRDDEPAYRGSPSLDIYDEGWMAFSRNGDIALFHRETLRAVPLPLTVNTDEHEFDPALVPTREGGYALIWERGLQSGPSSRFVARTDDFLRWQTPKRLVFEKPDGENGNRRGRIQGSSDVVPVPGGYLMLLEDGHVRFSEDLVAWGIPEKRFDYDGLRQRTVLAGDGRIWIAATRHDDREIEAGKHPADGFGFYRTADGRVFEKNETVVVYASTDGRTWSEGLSVHSGAEPSGLWLFPVGADSVAVAVGYGNLDLRIFRSTSPESFMPVRSSLKMPLNSEEVAFFPADGSFWSARVVHDYVNEDFVLLLSGSKRLFPAFSEAGAP